MRIPEKPLVPGGGLLNRELLGSHAIEEHVGGTLGSLMERSNTWPKFKKKPDGFSIFKDLEEAEYFVAETINKNQVQIQNWLNTGTKQSERFDFSFNNPTGKFLTDGTASLIDVYKVRVVLKPEKSSPGGYKLITAYPIK